MKCKYFISALSFPHILSFIVFEGIRIDDLFISSIIIYCDVSKCLAFDKNILRAGPCLTFWKMFSYHSNIIEKSRNRQNTAGLSKTKPKLLTFSQGLLEFGK